MRLIFIYGPPATGKLAVAKELQRLTKYKLFHNHHTVDLVGSVFEFGTDIYFKLNSKFRLELIETAAKENINGIIFTYVYSHPDDDKFVKAIIKKVEKHNGEVSFIQLYCNETELIKRVKNISRKKFDKLKTIKDLKDTLKKWDCFTPIPFCKSLIIDNTKISPQKTAKIIKRRYNL